MEVTYLLAILVNKDVLSLEEAQKLRKALRANVVNDNLSEMITKVGEALESKDPEIKTVDAMDVLNAK